MKVLIAYGTTEGQTRKVAKAVADEVGKSGHSADLFHTADLPGDWRLDSFDKIVLAGSVHEERHQESLQNFVVANREVLDTKPTLFLSVCLAAAFDDGEAEAKSYIENFIADTGWRPARHLSVAGAVRHGEYGFYNEQILKHVVLEKRDLDDPEIDHEFTDWAALAKTVRKFIEA